MQLRSLWLRMIFQIPITDRANMVRQMLFVCPRLQILVVRSDELALCLEQKPALILSSLNHLHLHLSQIHEMVDPMYLATAFPNISYLSTGTGHLYIDTRLGYVILNLINTLPYLRRLRFNDHNFPYNGDSDQIDDNLVVSMLQNSEQLRSMDCCVRMFENSHLVIWL
jgi:hypothetical protein